MTKSDLIKLFFQNNYTLAPSLLELIPDMDSYTNLIEKTKQKIIKQDKITTLTEDIIKNFLYDKKEEPLKNDYLIKLVQSYSKLPEKREIQDFVKYFRKRYEALKEILSSRIELQNSISISRALEKQKSEKVSIIGLVSDKNITKNGNVILTVEDTTGSIKIIITKKNEETFKKTEEIVFDEVIGITGTIADKAIFANDVLFPDVPTTKELKKSSDEVIAAFISDIHVGSNLFLPNEFLRFISWINGEAGTEEQKEEAKKVKYLFIIGDLVDGVGIYQNQENELTITDIKEQYDKCAEYLAMIRPDINMIICAGNHDAVRRAEPQPILDIRYAKAIHNLPNVTLVSNPSIVNIHSSDIFPGFDVLMYHGYSFDHYVANVNSIRNKGGYDRADLIMQFLLQKRHLAPTHSSTLYIPEKEEDPLVIQTVPDIMATGHLHKASISMYKGISTICGSCWQAKTLFQEKVGHNPEPARVPIVNLKTRQMKMLKFGD